MVELMALLPDAGGGDTARRSHHGSLHQVLGPDKPPIDASVSPSQGEFRAGSPWVCGRARPDRGLTNKSVMVRPSAMNSAKPSASSRWSQTLPVEGGTPRTWRICPSVS